MTPTPAKAPSAESSAASLLHDATAAAALAAVVSGAPSTVHALLSRRHPLEATLAAGTLLLPGERRPGPLLVAAAAVHITVSFAWALVLAATLPRERTAAAGALAGLAIAALDLGIVGRRFPRIRALPLVPQLADHIAYGASVGAVLARRRAQES